MLLFISIFTLAAFGIALAVILTVLWIGALFFYAAFFDLRRLWRWWRARRARKPFPCLPANDDVRP